MDTATTRDRAKRHSDPVRAAPLLAALLATAAAGTGRAHAQAVAGRVIERDGGGNVAGAQVLLLDRQRATASSISDSTGTFYLDAPAAGVYALRVERIGYEPTVTDTFSVARGEVVEVELRIGTRPVPIEPVVVVGRRELPVGSPEFQRRYEERGKAGFGRFMTRDDIADQRARTTSNLLTRFPELHVYYLSSDEARGASTTQLTMNANGQPCIPRTYVDGTFMRPEMMDFDKLVTPNELAGVEFYRSPTEAPPQYQDPYGCGTLLLWTRHDVQARSGSGWWRYALGGGLGVLIGVLFFTQLGR